jgi:hypothetical protein
MPDQKQKSEYLVLSRGQWDEDKSPEEIQKAIDAFYDWHDVLVAAGKMKTGQRLAQATARVSKHGWTDGPFAETKEVIGGYWFFIASSLQEAAELARQNPCITCGLTYEVRPVETERCSAFADTIETPQSKKKSRA